MQIPKQVSSQELNAFDENNYESTLFEGHTLNDDCLGVH